MNNALQNLAASGGIGILFLFQFFLSAGNMNFLLFPAGSLYLATFMNTPMAIAAGVLVGSLWDSVSPLPFGMYMLLFGGTMGSISFFMKLVDERNITAHGFAAACSWGLYGMTLGIIYFLLEKEYRVFILHGYDMLAGFFVLLLLTIIHACIRNLRKHP